MAYRIEFHPAAESEIYEAAAWYAERSTAAAQRFVAEVEAKIQRVLENPDRWPRFEAETRRLLFHEFPYSIIYRVVADSIEVVAVMHQKRKPGYWVERIG